MHVHSITNRQRIPTHHLRIKTHRHIRSHDETITNSGLLILTNHCNFFYTHPFIAYIYRYSKRKRC